MENKTRYYTILTKLGKIAVSNAIGMNEKVDFAYISLGDGGGKEYEPTEEQIELKGKKTDKIKIHNIIVLEENSQIEIQAIIGAAVGGFTIREAGIYDSKGNLLAISKIAERTKPSLSEGSGVDMFFKLRLEVSNTSIVNINVDPSALLVNINQFNQYKEEMNKEFNKLEKEVREALAGGELEEVIISIKDDLDEHIANTITTTDIHGMALVDEELFRRTDKGNVPIKLDKKNIKGKLDISEISGKATIAEAKEGTNDIKYMTPKKTKDFILEYGDGLEYIYEHGATAKYGDMKIISNGSPRFNINNGNITGMINHSGGGSGGSNYITFETKFIDVTKYRSLILDDITINASEDGRTGNLSFSLTTDVLDSNNRTTIKNVFEDRVGTSQVKAGIKTIINISELSGNHKFKFRFGGSVDPYVTGSLSFGLISMKE